MSIRFKTVEVNFSHETGVPKNHSKKVTFDDGKEILNADACIKHWSVQFNNIQTYIHEAMVGINNVDFHDSIVEFDVKAGITPLTPTWGPNFPYDAIVEVLVIAEIKD